MRSEGLFQAHTAENQENVIMGLERAEGQEAGKNVIVLSYQKQNYTQLYSHSEVQLCWMSVKYPEQQVQKAEMRTV